MWFLWCVIMCVSSSAIETNGDALIFPVDSTQESSNGSLDPAQGLMHLDGVQKGPSNHGDGGLFALCHGLFLSSAFGIATIFFIISGIHFMWVDHFTVAWGLSKRNSITLLNLLTLISAVAGIPIAKTVDRFGGCKTSESTSKTMKLIFAFMFTSVCGAIIAVCTIHTQLESLNTFGEDLQGSSHGLQALGTNGHLSVCFIGMLISFTFSLATLCGLLNVNVSALPPSSVKLGQGFTISLQNLVGFFMGPFLPRVLMQILEDYHFAKANAYCYSMACVWLSTLVPLFFIFCGWCKPFQLCNARQDRQADNGRAGEHPGKRSESATFVV